MGSCTARTFVNSNFEIATARLKSAEDQSKTPSPPSRCLYVVSMATPVIINANDRRYSPISPSGRSRSSPKRKSRIDQSHSGSASGRATQSGKRHWEIRNDRQMQYADEAAQIQREEKTLAQDPYRHLDDSPSSTSRHPLQKRPLRTSSIRLCRTRSGMHEMER